MGDFVILTDSSTDLTKDLRERFGVTDYLPGIVVLPDGKKEESTLDWELMSPDEYYGSMTKDAIYTTGIKNIELQEAFFEKYLQQGYDILNISLSSALSGTYGQCKVAAEKMMEKYPDRKIIVVDSVRYSGGLGLLVSYAGEMKQQGKSMEEIADWLNVNKYRVHQMGTVDDLNFLKRSGRVSNIAAFMGGLINIKPMAECDRKGMNTVMGKVTGYKKMFAASMEYMKRTIEPNPKRIFVSHTYRKAQWIQMQELIKENFHPEEIIATRVNMANGTAIGPGMIVAFYLGNEISENLEAETKIFNEVKAGL